jgi:hypothetical protein
MISLPKIFLKEMPILLSAGNEEKKPLRRYNIVKSGGGIRSYL